MKLGVNWYLAADESHNNDGKHINYLNANVQKNLRKFKACDPELYDQLGLIVRNKSRAVKTVQESRVLPSDTVFYDKTLSFDPDSSIGERMLIRKIWLEEGFNKLTTCDLVFFDPDNGLEVKSVNRYSRKGPKYVFYDELVDYYNRGQSLIIYNHRNREPQSEYENRFRKIAEFIPQIDRIIYLRYNRGTTRDYVFVLQPRHKELIASNIKKFLESQWNQHFTYFEIIY